MPRKAKPTCLRPSCGGSGRLTRGLCRNCYRTARLLVKSGEISWEVLEERGKALVATREYCGERRAWFLAED